MSAALESIVESQRFDAQDEDTHAAARYAFSKFNVFLMTGHAGAGKDACARVLNNVRTGGCTRFSLAEPLRALTFEIWTVMSAAFGLREHERAPLRADNFADNELKDLPIALRAERVRAQHWSAPRCEACAAAQVSPYVFGPAACDHELFPTPLSAPHEHCVPARAVHVEGALSMRVGVAEGDFSEQPMTRALLCAWFADAVRRYTGFTFAPAKTAAAAQLLFDAFAELATRPHEARTVLPPAPCAPVVLGFSSHSAGSTREVASAAAASAFDTVPRAASPKLAAPAAPRASLAPPPPPARAGNIFWQSGRLVALVQRPRSPLLGGGGGGGGGSGGGRVSTDHIRPAGFAPFVPEPTCPFLTITRLDDAAGDEACSGLQFAGMGPLTPRALLKFVGTDVCRTCLDDQIWIHSLLLRVKSSGVLTPPNEVSGGSVVVTDVRFHNEIERLHASFCRDGNAVVRARVVDPSAAPRAPCSVAVHASEAGIDSLTVDAVVSNDKRLGYAGLEHALEAALRAATIQHRE